MRRFLLLAAVSFLPSAGCGPSDRQPSSPENAAATAAASPAPAAAPASAKACDVLTEADAEKALGHDADRLPNDGGPAALDICQYGYQGERIMDAGNVSVTVHPVDFASMKKGVTDAGYSVEPVDGLGDQAFWSSDVGLYVGKGNRTAIYLLGIGSEKADKDRTIALAKATLSRL